MIIYANCMPERFDGWTIGPVSIIRPSKRDDRGLHAHEAVHRRQFCESFGLSGVRYLVSKKWRQHYEVEAYREQLKFSPHCLGLFAGYLSENYKLGLSKEVAKALLLRSTNQKQEGASCTNTRSRRATGFL